MTDNEVLIKLFEKDDLQQQTSPFKVYIQKEVPMLENLLEFYRKSDGKTKKKILGCIFAEKLILDKGKFAIPVRKCECESGSPPLLKLRRTKRGKKGESLSSSSLALTLTLTLFYPSHESNHKASLKFLQGSLGN